MYICIFVFMYCMYEFVYIYIYTYIYCMHTFIYVYIYMQITHIHISVCIYIYTRTYVDKYKCMTSACMYPSFLKKCTYIDVCEEDIFVYIYVYIYMHTLVTSVGSARHIP